MTLKKFRKILKFNKKRLKRPSLKKRAPRRRKTPTPSLSKNVSVMAWIEDVQGNLLLVKQSRGKKAWSLPGGKVRPRETLLGGLRREVKEELGLNLDVACPIDIYDRTQKSTLVILFRAVLKPDQTPRPRRGEIEKYAFRRTPPNNTTPSLRFFWTRAQLTFEPLSLFWK